MNSLSNEERFWENYAVWNENPIASYTSRDLLIVDWKSRKDRGMDHFNDKLSSSMLNALKHLLLNKQKKPGSTTMSALQKRHLANGEGELTDYGLVLALRNVPLEQQCKFLNLPLEEWMIHWENSPEDSVKKIFIERGARAYFVENTFGLFIDYLMGDVTVAVANKLGKNVYTLNLPYDPELFFWVKRELDEYLSSFDINHCQTNFAICSPCIND